MAFGVFWLHGSVLPLDDRRYQDPTAVLEVVRGEGVLSVLPVQGWLVKWSRSCWWLRNGLWSGLMTIRVIRAVARTVHDVQNCGRLFSNVAPCSHEGFASAA